MDKVLKTQKDIREIYQELSYDELTEVLNKWLNPKDEEAEGEDTDSVSSTLTNPTTTTADASQAFDELFAK